MIRTLILLTLLLAGCASEIMKTYLGKDVTEIIMDRGAPDGVMDLPDGRRAFMWNATQSMVIPATTNYSGTVYGNQVIGHATTTGGHVSTWECTYTFLTQKNPHGSYTVVDFRQPSLECE